MAGLGRGPGVQKQMLLRATVAEASALSRRPTPRREIAPDGDSYWDGEHWRTHDDAYFWTGRRWQAAPTPKPPKKKVRIIGLPVGLVVVLGITGRYPWASARSRRTVKPATVLGAGALDSSCRSRSAARIVSPCSRG